MNQSKEPMNKKHARKKQSMYTHHIGFASADSSLLNASQGVKYAGPLNIGSRIFTSCEFQDKSFNRNKKVQIENATN